MKVLLDTNVCIYFLNHSLSGAHSTVVKRFHDARPDNLAVSTLTVAELHYGAELSSRADANHARLDIFTSELRVLPFDADCATRFAILKAELRRKGKTIPDFDVAIAATALTTGRILASKDRHMRFVDHLTIEDWTVG